MGWAGENGRANRSSVFGRVSGVSSVLNLSEHCKSLLKRVMKNSSDEFIATDEDPGWKKLTEGEGETIMIKPRPMA